MATITLSVPEELKKCMDEHPEMNWVEWSRESILEKIGKLIWVKSVASHNKLSEEDSMKLALELGRKIKKGRFEELKKQDWV